VHAAVVVVDELEAPPLVPLPSVPPEFSYPSLQ
jgi:hypothetical protein